MSARPAAAMSPRPAHAHGAASPPLGIYLHIPYCKTLCPYCDFVKERARSAPDVFVDAICQEIQAYTGPVEAQSIFFGGGTPSLLPPQALERILETLHATFRLDAPEITLEANPDDVTPELVAAWRALGVNRISMGVQSLDERVLRYLGRRHDVAGAFRAIELVGKHFENWNMDLIFGAPPVEAWRTTLEKTVALRPPHIAAYGLSYEAGTPFGRRTHEAVDDETALGMYREAETLLAAYEHYEISNFCLPGQESRHNLVYWHNGPYAGFGTGAYSYLGGSRARNHATNDAYLAAPGEKMEALALSAQEEQVETLIQHFRLRAGLPKARYRERFGREPAEDFGEALALLVDRGLIRDTKTHLLPTQEGFYLNNEIGLALVCGESR